MLFTLTYIRIQAVGPYIFLLLALSLGVLAQQANSPHFQPGVFQATISGKQVDYRHFTVNDGLSGSTVHCILQDENGFLWIGTDYGLNRYDGYTFRQFEHDPNNQSSLSDNFIRQILIDSAGNFWIATGYGGLNLLDRRTERFTHFRHDPENHESVSTDALYVVFEDSQGSLWVGTQGGGLNKVHLSEQPGMPARFERIWADPESGKGPSSNYTFSIHEDQTSSQQSLWIATIGGGLNRFDRETGTFEYFKNDPNDPTSISNNFVWRVASDSDHPTILWVGTGGGGLNRFDITSKTFTRFVADPTDPDKLSNGFVNYILPIRGDEGPAFWLGTGGGGLNHFVPTSATTPDQFSRFVDANKHPGSPATGKINAILQDNSGNIWIGNDQAGLTKITFRDEGFRLFRRDENDANSLVYNKVKSIGGDKAGNIWVGTSKGLSKISGRLNNQHQFTNYEFDPVDTDGLPSNEISAILVDFNATLWVGTYGQGLSRLVDGRGSGRFHHYKKDAANPTSISFNHIFDLHQSASYPDYLWVATVGGGLNRMNLNTEEFETIGTSGEASELISDNLLLDIYEAPSMPGVLWIGTENGGLNRLDMETLAVTHYRYDSANPNSLSGNAVSSIVETPDEPGVIWIATNIGLNRLDTETGDVKRLNSNDGLSSNTVFGLNADETGHLWMITKDGLSRMNTNTFEFSNYDVKDGLQGNEFTLGAIYTGIDGTVYVGGTDGLNSFHPSRLRGNPHIPSVAITDFFVFNQPVGIATPGKAEAEDVRLLAELISYASHIELAHNENVFSFEFAAMDFTSPAKNRYAYKMEDFDKDWVYAGDRRFVTYTNLDPGTYTFRVRGSNNDGVWNDEGASVRLTITPPWWRSAPAYGFYIVLAFLALIGYRNFERRRARFRQELKMQRFEAKKLQEVDRLKSRFFANISHEFRTPLTLILALVDKLSERNGAPETENDLSVMRRNARRLLQLINQLLELSKIEAGETKLQAQETDIVKFVHRLLLSFSSLAEQKNISLIFNSTSATENSGQVAIHVFADQEKLEKVFYNLFSNAFKFTPESGEIGVEISTGKSNATNSHSVVAISVYNTGPGIPADKLPHIFDRFYQAEDGTTRQYEGSGIGLALVRELVEIHQGDVAAQSEPDVRTTFLVNLPLGRAHLADEQIVADASDAPFDQPGSPEEFVVGAEVDGAGATEVSTAPDGSALPLVLIVEDNKDLRQLIREQLESNYTIIEAENGRLGLEHSLERIPDLVISDIMMPEMDGYQLCSSLKSDEKTNHIPIILLTARADKEDKLSGLETGADDYLIKPFDPKELQIRAQNLISSRQQLREKFSSEMLLRPSEITVSSVHKEFLEKLTSVIEERIEDESFSIEEMGQVIGMSRSQLHRKLTSLTAKTPSEFLRTFRLQRATELIKQEAGNFAEITYMVGFSSQAYFTRCFNEEFGMSPREYKKRNVAT